MYNNELGVKHVVISIELDLGHFKVIRSIEEDIRFTEYRLLHVHDTAGRWAILSRLRSLRAAMAANSN
jgi:hypothetical protein